MLEIVFCVVGLGAFMCMVWEQNTRRKKKGLPPTWYINKNDYIKGL